LGPPPRQRRRLDEIGELVPEEREQKAILEARKMKARGASLRTIATTLRKKGCSKTASHLRHRQFTASSHPGAQPVTRIR
jgi:hypothetical protein